jgi:hypothetical protein
MDIPTLVVVAVVFSIAGAVVTLAVQRVRARPARAGQAAALNRQVASEKWLLAVMANADYRLGGGSPGQHHPVGRQRSGGGKRAPTVHRPAGRGVVPGLPQFAEHARRALAGEELTATLETPALIYEAKFAPLKEDSGQPGGALGILIDIPCEGAEQELNARIDQLDMLQRVEVELERNPGDQPCAGAGTDAAMRLSQAHAALSAWWTTT